MMQESGCVWARQNRYYRAREVLLRSGSTVPSVIIQEESRIWEKVVPFPDD